VPVLPIVLAAAAVDVPLLAAAAVLLSGFRSPGTAKLALAAGATVAAVAVMAGTAAWAARQQGRRRLGALRQASADNRAHLPVLATAIRDGLPVSAAGEPGPEPRDRDPYALLEHALRQEWHAVRLALAQAAGPPDYRVDVFVHLARRMQSLLHREISEIDEIEREVEDPRLLRGLFSVDHLATRMRRHTESLAVLGGSQSRRHWSRPVPLDHVLRAAIAETEDYARVTLVPPVPGILMPGAVADVIHLVAELIENAAKFSRPGTQVMVHAMEVAAGLAIDVEDRGLGMEPAERQRINAILAGRADVEVGELLADGRIGIYVVAALARRHGILAELRGNVFGGTQAVVVLPALLARAGSPSALPVPERAPAEAPGLPWEPRILGQAPRAPLGDADTGPWAPAAAGGVSGLPQAGNGERPPLPRRGNGSHMSPQLRGRTPDAGLGAADDAAPAPGLMADFLNGVRRAEGPGGSPELRHGPR